MTNPPIHSIRSVLLRGAVFCLFLLLFMKPCHGTAFPAGESPYQQVAGLMDLRSTFSDGAHSVEELVGIARARGFRVLFLNDHDRISLSYGIPPFRNVLRYKKTYPSIMTHGPEKFLQEVERISRENPDIILIPGCETSPFYYWTGSYFKNDLTAHDYERRLLLVNFDDPEDYRSLPVVGNEFSLRYWTKLLPGLLLFVPPLLIGLFLLRWKGVTRLLGALLTLLSCLGALDSHPFRGSTFSPYRGEQGILPYQTVIDYANERGALSFWNYPEQQSGVRSHGPIRVSTLPYPQVLCESKGYTGFSAIYGEWMKLTEPGKEWDKALEEYCRGLRKKAPWGVSTADFHEEGRLGQKLGAFPTVFLVKELTGRAILEAMEKGRMYCARGDGADWPRLSTFHVQGGDGTQAVMGETLMTRSRPVVRFQVTYPSGKRAPLTILLIRGGVPVQTFEGETPLRVAYVDSDAPAGVTTYYRIMDEKKNLTSNPVFVRYQPEVSR